MNMEKELLSLQLVEAIMAAKRFGFVGLEAALYEVAETLNEEHLLERSTALGRRLNEA